MSNPMSASTTTTRRDLLSRVTGLMASGLALGGTKLSAHEAEGGPAIKPLFQKALADHPGEQVSMTVVEYPPGTASKPHKHHGPVFVYVLEGTVELQVAGGPLTKVSAGGTFYEAPGGIHTVSRNASATQAAKLLAFIIGKADTPVTLPAETAQ